MRFPHAARRWMRRAWRASRALTVLVAALIVATSVARDAAVRAQATAALARLPAVTPNTMPTMGGGTQMAMRGDPHMMMTPLTGRPTAAGTAAAQAILAAAREAAARYADNTVALDAGYKQATPFFHGTAHYTNYAFAALAGAHLFDPRRPTSLLYTRSGKEYHLVGVMFTAPESDTVADLNALVPTSIARWHYHHDLCISGVLIGRAPNAASCVAGGAASGGPGLSGCCMSGPISRI